MLGLFGKKEEKPQRIQYKLPHPEWSSLVRDSDYYIAFSAMGRSFTLEMLDEMRNFGFKPMCVSTWSMVGSVLICEKLMECGEDE